MVITGHFGNKARGLAALRHHGFRGLPFCSLPTAALLQGEQPNWHAVAHLLGQPAYYAVRSSSSTEDTEDHAAAGAFLTLLGISFESLPSACLEVAKSLPAQGPHEPHGVVIQAFLSQPDASGVLFTHDHRYMVNVAPGLCTHVVNGGDAEAHAFHPSGKRYAHQLPKAFQGLQWVEGQMQPFIQSGSAWSAALAKELHATYRKVKKHFARPMDLEWSFYQGRLYLLQARPVTRDWLIQPWLLDDSNLAESYTGTVQPMTASIAQRLYRHVYQDLLAASGVSRKKIIQHKDIFEHLVASYHGRMYYVMNHWYAMMAFLPGYGRNKENLERMISAQTKAEPFLPESLQPSWALRLTYFPLVIWKLAMFSYQRKKFEQRVRQDFQTLHAQQWNHLSTQELMSLWSQLEQSWLRKWYITVENDTALMTLLGWAEKKFSDEIMQDYLSMDTPSVAQIRAFHYQAKRLCGDPSIKKALQELDPQAFEAALHNLADQGKAWHAYLAEYGGRFPNELKLEDPSPLDDFSLLASTLLELAAQPTPAKRVRLKNAPLPWGIRKLRQFIQQREALRLLRSSAFGWLRKILLTSGQRYAENGDLTHPEDVFWLEISEWEKGAHPEWTSIIEARKKSADAHRDDRYPQSFAAMPGEEAPAYIPSSEHTPRLEGKTVFPGRVQGTALVMASFRTGPYPPFDILVAKHTDPGWSLLIAQAKGLIVEQGGLLSHSSIVARELGIPTIIGVPNATEQIQTGMTLFLDATAGNAITFDT